MLRPTMGSLETGQKTAHVDSWIAVLASNMPTMQQAIVTAQAYDEKLELNDNEMAVLAAHTDKLARGVPGRDQRVAFEKALIDAKVEPPRAKELSAAWSLAYKASADAAKGDLPLAVKAIRSAKVFSLMRAPPEGFTQSSSALAMLRELNL